MAPPTTIEIIKAYGKPTGEYIVELSGETFLDAVLNKLGSNEARKATHKFTKRTHGFAGFAGSFNPTSLGILQRAAPEGVIAITEDTFIEPDVPVNQGPSPGAVRVNVPWGLTRLSSAVELPPGLLPGARIYRYDNAIPPIVGNPDVDLYILDSGIAGTHTQFNGREVINSPNFSTSPDLTTHGTWVASIAASNTYGVNKHPTCKLINVKVLPGGTVALVNALAWVRERAAAPANAGRASVVNYSGGKSVQLPLQGGAPPHDNPKHQAFQLTVAANIHVVVSAGNQAQNINDVRVENIRCPSHIPDVITVGGTEITDAIRFVDASKGSNCGAAVTVFAPGGDIIGARFDDLQNNNPFISSGTSAATPHVSGLVAYLLKIEGPRTPAQMKARIIALARNAVNLAPNPLAVPAGTTTRLVANGLVV